MNLDQLNVILSEVKNDMMAEFFDEPKLGSPKSRLKKAGYEIVKGKMTAKAKRLIKKITGKFGFEVLKRLGHTIEPIGATR